MNKPNLFEQSKKECCGCCACEDICPTKAITMKPDSEGFLYPEIDAEKCCGCKKCENACAFKKKDATIRTSTISEQYAIKYINKEIRQNSQAGGSFAALAIALFDNNKDVIVYGAAYDAIYKVKHKKIYNKEFISKLQGSKYIQSDMRGVYQAIESDLKNGETVMFAGTPCQNHAVKEYLLSQNVDMTNLFLMDFICEGVAAPRVWEEYIKAIENRFKGQVEKVIFRDTRYGKDRWIGHYETIQIKNKRMIIGRKWTNCFCDCLFFRESCHNCKYTSLNRESDITVSWFGNVNRKLPGFDDGYGVSGVMINTLKGKEWFELQKNELEVASVSMDDLMQNQLQKPIEKSALRSKFWQDFENDKDAWLTLSNYDTKNTIKRKIIRFVKNITQRKLRWI